VYIIIIFLPLFYNLFKNQIRYYFFQTTILCEPNIDGYGGVPAGCQCDKDNVIWIADMRLGILTMDKSGNFKQVLSKGCPILQW
jgi:hypothetical protein